MYLNFLDVQLTIISKSNAVARNFKRGERLHVSIQIPSTLGVIVVTE